VAGSLLLGFKRVFSAMEGFSPAFGAANRSGHMGSAEIATVRYGTGDGTAAFGAHFVGVMDIGLFWCGDGMRAALTAMGSVGG